MKKSSLSPIEKVYSAFYLSKKEKIYFNELREINKLSISSLQNALTKLEKRREILKIKEKGNVFYSLIKKEEIAIKFTKFDILRFNELNLEIKIPLKDFLEQFPKQVKFILLFGSASRKQEKQESDIDLLVILQEFSDKKLQSLYEKEIKGKFETARKKVNSRSNHPLSLAFVDSKEFKISKDHLIIQAKETGFPIWGSFQHYNE